MNNNREFKWTKTDTILAILIILVAMFSSIVFDTSTINCNTIKEGDINGSMFVKSHR